MTGTLFAFLLFISVASAGPTAAPARWRAASEEELRKIIPARAPVVKEHIETELRTASGVTDGRGHFIAGVVMITAGYSAEGKYSHFFITQVPLRMGNMVLQPGEYVFGYQRTGSETIRLSFYSAQRGEAVGDVEGRINRRSTQVRSLLITPPTGGRGLIQVGRFLVEYRAVE